MIYILLILFLTIYVLKFKKHEYFWPIIKCGEWFKLNQDKYNSKISYNIITRLDCKINLYGIIKNEYYCPKSILEIDKDNGHYSPKSVWFIKERSSGGGGSVYPTQYKNIKTKIKTLMKQNTRPISKYHIPAYSKKNKYIIQKEISPWLINGKKCDLRIFYVIVFTKNNVKFYLSNDGYIKINSLKYVKNSTDKSIQITNNMVQKNAHNNILISENNYYNKMMSKLILLFTNLSKKIKVLFKNLHSKYQIEYQVCGADVIFDNLLNPYLLELNSGWPAYTQNNNSKNIKNLKKNTKTEISEMVYNSINNIPIKNKYLVPLKI